MMEESIGGGVDAVSIMSEKKPVSMKVRNQQLRDQIVQEVLDKVLPTLGDCGDSEKVFRPMDSFHIRWLRLIGCLSLNLHDAILSGSIEEVERTLKKLCKGPFATPELINEYNQAGMTPLSVAAKLNDLDICAELVDYHAIIECVDEGTGRTPLFHAVQNRNHDLIFLLLKYNANANVGDMQCMTPLMLASSTDDYKTVRMLCKANADVDLQDECGWTAVHYAVYGNAVKSLAILLHEGADREIRDINGKKALTFATFRDYDQCISLLCKKHVPLA